MYRIIYLSYAAKLLSEGEINVLLEQSRKNNLEKDITGALLYIDGDFLQIIEGSKEYMIPLFENIKKDPRHNGIICVFNGHVLQKEFPDWSMGFCSTKYEKIRAISGFENFDRKELLQINDKTAIVFLDAFKKSHRNKIVYV